MSHERENVSDYDDAPVLAQPVEPRSESAEAAEQGPTDLAEAARLLGGGADEATLAASDAGEAPEAQPIADEAPEALPDADEAPAALPVSDEAPGAVQETAGPAVD